MKDILIIGGAGKIGLEILKRLVDSNYNITVLDLESRVSIKRLASVKDRIRVVYGDVEDSDLVRDLVKRNDIVIHAAGVMPPLAELNEKIANTNYIGSKIVVDAINELNPECKLVYLSFVCIYGTTPRKVRKLNVTTESTYPDDFYSVSLVKSEGYIKNNLKDYTILRMPIVLTRNNYFLKHIKLDRSVDFITKEDMADIVVRIFKNKKTQCKIYNISGFKAKARDVVRELYKATGKLSVFKRNLYYGEYEDSSKLEKVINIKYTSLKEYIEDERRQTSKMKRLLRKMINSIKYVLILIKK